MDPYADPFYPMRPPMAQANVVEDDDVIGAAATAEAIAEYDLSELSAKQIKKLSNYGAILDRLTPDQIAAVLEENQFSPGGHALVIMPKPKGNPPAKTVRYTLDPNGKKIYR
jgi:hypothetical protein